MINPYFLYSIVSTLMLLLYSLEWSFINPLMSRDLKLFLIITIFLSFIFGLFFHFYIPSKNTSEKNFNKNKMKLVSGFIITGIFIEAIYSRGLPIFSIVRGATNYSEFGIPMFHVVLMTISFFYALVSFEYILLNQHLKQNIWNFFISLLPAFLTVNRGILVMICICSFFLFFRKQKIRLKLKHFFVTFVILFIAIYLFGIFGNFRMNKDYKRDLPATNSELIMSVGGATENFKNSAIPKPFFWTYSYLTSPVANLEINWDTNKNMQNSNKVDYNYYFVTQFLPDFISKRIYPYKKYASLKVKNEMTAGTLYMDPLIIAGRPGMIFIFLYSLIFPVVYIYLLKRYANEYFDISLSVLCCIYFLSFFTNFFTYSALSLQLMIPFVLVFCKRIRI